MTTSSVRNRGYAIGAALVLVCAVGACRRGSAEPPVATPTVTVEQARVPRGGVVAVHYRFAVAADTLAFKGRYTVFVHAIDSQGRRAWTSDHEPPTPLTGWKPGAIVEYTRPMTIPRGAPLGEVSLQIGLYSPDTGRRLPLSGTEAERRSYRVASLTIVPEAGVSNALSFAAGWHQVEAPEDAQGAEWHWSKGTAKLSVHNPHRDAVLILDIDQPLPTAAAPQHVEVQSGSTPIGNITLKAGERTLSRFPVTAAQLGDEDVARFTILVDRTFVPARLSGAGSQDQRELGVRVFSATLEPVSAQSPAP